MKENRELLLAALLCDFQRFYGKSAEQFVQENAELFAKYLDVKKLTKILRKDKEYCEFLEIIAEARDLSLMESIKTDGQDKRLNLTTVFSRIRMDSQEKIPPKRYNFYPLSPKACFPMQDVDKERDISDLREDFKKEIRELSVESPDTFEAFLHVFDSILERYLWCVTASDYEGEDISLYAHLKNTAVIAMCRWSCTQEENAKEGDYCMVMADFSGIQKYIFSVNNVNESGVTKRLRARSFLVDIMVTVLSHVLIHKFQVSMQHILLLTGGKFYLLLPNLPLAEQMLEEAKREFNQYIFDKFKGQITVNLVWLSGGRELLENYSETVAVLSEKLIVERSGCFREVLQDENGWREECFELYTSLANKKICSSCGGELAEKTELYCQNCRQQEKMGTELPRAKYVVYSRTAFDYEIYAGYGISLLDKMPESQGYLVEKLNDSYFSSKEKTLPAKCRFMANHIPLELTGRPKSFQEIAQCAEGDKKLGVLKADVDTLGFIFSSGLRDTENPAKHYGTISRSATMSKLLVVFFSGYVDMLLDDRKGKFQDIYCVFSGGDDLFLIGPWNVICDFALRIHEDFCRFTGNNPNLTLSAAVELFQSRTHISYMAEQSEKALKAVKNETRVIYPQRHGRNGISCLNTIFTWDDFNREWNRAKGIAKWWLKDAQGRRSFPMNRMRNIQTYSKLYQSFLVDHDVMGLMCSPYLEYDMNRNYDRKRLPEELWEYLLTLKNNAANYKKLKPELYFADFCMFAVNKLTREERTDGI